MASSSRRRQPPAKTAEERENQMISLALDLAEEQLRNGTATSQVVTHYLKLATTREALEREKLQKENHLLKVRADAHASGQKVEQMYQEAIVAFRGYSGQETQNAEDYEDYED